MHNQEWNELVDCCECGATVAPETDRTYAMNDHAFLCFECAVRRGGVYDADDERWAVPPDVAGVPDEPAHP